MSNTKLPWNQPDSSPAIKDFHTWYSQARCPGVLSPLAMEEGHEFVPCSKIKEYFRDAARVRLILEDLFPDRWEDVSVQCLEDVQYNYCKVFAILLRIGEGQLIEEFVRYRNKQDIYLPLNNPDAFPPPSTRPLDLFNRFYQEQWTFCATDFAHMQHVPKILNEEEILPIVSSEKLRKGDCASVYKIELHPDYNHLHRHKREIQVRLIFSICIIGEPFV